MQFGSHCKFMTNKTHEQKKYMLTTNWFFVQCTNCLPLMMNTKYNVFKFKTKFAFNFYFFFILSTWRSIQFETKKNKKKKKKLMGMVSE